MLKDYAPNRCESSIEVIMKMGVEWGVGVWGVWVDVNETVKFL